MNENINLTQIFPELKESDDEKIRRWIIDVIIYNMINEPLNNSEYKKKAEKAIAWLEKQGERNLPSANERAWLYLVSDVLTWKDGIGQYLDDPRVQELAKRLCSEYAHKLYNPSSDKIEPRFNVGDWVVNKFGDSWHIDSLDKKNYQVSDGKGNYNYFPISKQDKMHLWTIQDAKDGDVLACNEEILLFKSYSVQGRISLYCWYNEQTNNFHGKEVIDTLLTKRNEICPATKKQCDLLFQKIKEAGCKWNAETKTLEKLIKPKFKVGDRVRHKETNKDDVYEITKVYDDSYGIDGFTWMIYMKYQDQYELVPNKFDPKTLKQFDRVLVRDTKKEKWNIEVFSYIDEDSVLSYVTPASSYIYCIPYNDETKHLVGTKEEAPEYYRY